jgi:hypothetical protein
VTEVDKGLPTVNLNEHYGYINTSTPLIPRQRGTRKDIVIQSRMLGRCDNCSIILLCAHFFAHSYIIIVAACGKLKESARALPGMHQRSSASACPRFARTNKALETDDLTGHGSVPH